jgi:hypothetical protein
MIAKLFEVRDAGTFIPVLAVQLGSRDEAERWLAARAGYGRSLLDQEAYVFLCKIDDDAGGTYDPHAWPGGARTMQVAHQFIINHFKELDPGAVVDVEYIIGDRDEPKPSERFVLLSVTDTLTRI